MSALLAVRDLSVTLRSGGEARMLAQDVSFDVARGQILSIVGESGSGKSMTAKALMGLLPPNATVSGEAWFRGANLLAKGSAPCRGTGIGLIFQEPMTALTPVLTIGTQLTEAMVVLGLADPAEARRRAIAMLDRVGIPAPDRRMRQYPHELSGGMRQRVMIAMMMLLEPEILIADEPTTALDVTVQAQILDLLRDIVRDTRIGLILITHDMGVVAETAQDVLVMKAGRTIEAGPVARIFTAPSAPYTRALLDAVPRLDRPGSSAGMVAGAAAGKTLLSAGHVSKTFHARAGLFASGLATRALDDVSLDIRQGETLALVGESGSGKSTLGRVITRLTDADHGAVTLGEENLLTLRGKSLRAARRKIQMIFQDPYASLDPRQRIGTSIAEPIAIHTTLSRAERQDRVGGLLARVGLTPEMAARYPHEFSGGQRQRIAIARALAAGPVLIVADEPTSALDVSIQAQILDLLADLKREEGLTMLFISHDLAVVRQIADRVAVMRQGRILELGPTEAVWTAARHPYTRALIDAAPVPDPTRPRGVRRPVSGDFAIGALREAALGHWVAT
ncbi:dipeptide ABC transporter ATP-binding protein [Puniceibacterium sediminis]|uniref:Peptide/nickel transport system ATP-binding protein n=1 Tax=Puniceibacterium sediminis TaxID=1608407 RepID=A0A238X673_9RHOB|nr:ABC transporter ATP-binding protein [Puniceibacterium sediminis]SNR53359.1 peptide/nickel transport system ATP-binding protein [Puniceibacterium sediminis]